MRIGLGALAIAVVSLLAEASVLPASSQDTAVATRLSTCRTSAKTADGIVREGSLHGRLNQSTHCWVALPPHRPIHSPEHLLRIQA